MASFVEMIGKRISKVRPRDEAAGEEPSEFSDAARACYDAIDAESPDAFEAALKSAIKACVAAEKEKETGKPMPEADEGEPESEPAKGY